MPKRKENISLQRALLKAEADLRLEGCPTPKWGQEIFKRVSSGHLSLDAARSEMKKYIASRLAAR